jgi:uncharacterized protein DUF3800
MLVFIDESGDPGMKSASSPYFVVTLVWFEDNDVANAVDCRIALLRKELGLPEHFEFHFSRIKTGFREAFLRAVAPYEFFYMSMIVNKRNLTGPGFAYPDSFYKWTVGIVFEDAKAYLDSATVVIDGSGSRQFRRQFQAYLRRRAADKSGEKKISKIKIQDSKSNNLLQLADMICGAVARSYTGKKDSREFRRLVAHREMKCQLWPK